LYWSRARVAQLDSGVDLAVGKAIVSIDSM
jgi:hypothetical protein